MYTYIQFQAKYTQHPYMGIIELLIIKKHRRNIPKWEKQRGINMYKREVRNMRNTALNLLLWWNMVDFVCQYLIMHYVIYECINMNIANGNWCCSITTTISMCIILKHISGTNRRPKVGPNLASKINKTWYLPNESLECLEAGNQNCPNQKYEHFCQQHHNIFKMAGIL